MLCNKFGYVEDISYLCHTYLRHSHLSLEFFSAQEFWGLFFYFHKAKNNFQKKKLQKNKMQLYLFEGNMLHPLPPLALETLGVSPHSCLHCTIAGIINH